MADAEVRVAGSVDTPEIARIQVSTWRSAYADVLPVEVLDGMDPAEARQQWEEAVGGDSAHVLLAAEGGWTVGFCAAGWAPEQEAAAADGTAPDDASSTALISALVVEPRWGRRGHGGRLMGEMAQRLHQHGATRGIVWLPEADEASRAFFHSVGWAPDGTVRTLDAGGRPVREMRFTGSLELQFVQD